MRILFAAVEASTRQPPPDEKAAAVCRRMRELRVDYGLSQRLVAKQIGLSRDQLNRIERGLVSPRFAPAWTFCEFTGANPLWLAFGDPYGRLGFAVGDDMPMWTSTSDVPAEMPFLDAMLAVEDAYVRYRATLLKVQGPPRTRFSMIFDPRSEKPVAPRLFKHYLNPGMASKTHTWENLRSRLHAATRSAGAKIALAHHFGVSAAAVSQWLSGATSPTADTALRLLQWVTAEEAKQQTESAARVASRPALKTRKSESTSHEKAKSDRKEK